MKFFASRPCAPLSPCAVCASSHGGPLPPRSCAPGAPGTNFPRSGSQKRSKSKENLMKSLLFKSFFIIFIEIYLLFINCFTYIAFCAGHESRSRHHPVGRAAGRTWWCALLQGAFATRGVSSPFGCRGGLGGGPEGEKRSKKQRLKAFPTVLRKAKAF